MRDTSRSNPFRFACDRSWNDDRLSEASPKACNVVNAVEQRHDAGECAALRNRTQGLLELRRLDGHPQQVCGWRGGSVLDRFIVRTKCAFQVKVTGIVGERLRPNHHSDALSRVGPDAPMRPPMPPGPRIA